MGRQVSIQVNTVMIDYCLLELLSEMLIAQLWNHITQTVKFLLEIFATNITDLNIFACFRKLSDMNAHYKNRSSEFQLQKSPLADCILTFQEFT